MEKVGLKAELKSLVQPIFVEIALIMLLGVVDTIMLSNMHTDTPGGSDDAVAAVGVDNQLINLVILIFQFVSIPQDWYNSYRVYTLFRHLRKTCPVHSHLPTHRAYHRGRYP